MSVDVIAVRYSCGIRISCNNASINGKSSLQGAVGRAEGGA